MQGARKLSSDDWYGYDPNRVWPIRRISIIYRNLKSVEMALVDISEIRNTDREN